MRVQSIDFNQMLVFSVFGHLMVLTVLLFLPKPRLLEKPFVPAFMVSLVSFPSGNQSPLRKQTAFKTRKVPKSIKPKNTPPVRKANNVLEDLNKLETGASVVFPDSKSLVEELDQVARLEKTERKKATTQILKKESVIEKTFMELEALKKKTIENMKAGVPAPGHEETPDTVDDLKVKENLTEPALKKQKELKNSKANEKDLLKELDQLYKLDALPVLIPEKIEKPSKPEGRSDRVGEVYNSILDKFELLAVDPAPVKVEVSSAKIDFSSFQSKLRNLPDSEVAESKGDSYVVSDKDETPSADVQSLYVGLVQREIYKNWREPLAEEHNQETIISFYIFPGGNIDKPFLKQSSEVDALDTLAVKAVLDSVPFPKFPKELKMSNLHINIHFKYVPKD